MTGDDAAPILDVRPRTQFESAHRPGSVNIPLEELPQRAHELPPRDQAVMIYDAIATRAEEAAAYLRTAQRAIAQVMHGQDWLNGVAVETGSSIARLWKPHTLIEEALTHVRAAYPNLRQLRALDLACGSGRDAVYLAMQGLTVEGWDNLADALEKCQDLASRNAVTVATRCVDIEKTGVLLAETFDLICCFKYLHRPLMPALAQAVRPRGFVVYETFVDPQRETFGKPSREQHVLHRGELPSYFPGWETVVYREGQIGPRQIMASLIASKP